MAKLFQSVKGFSPPRSLQNLSHTKLFTGDFGYLYPILSQDCIPGDVFSIANNVVLRMMPLTAPVLHRINLFVHYFFVPYRLLWDAGADDNWEDFISGGEDGADAGVIPTWDVTDVTEGSLWDHLNMPMGITPHADNRPVSFPQSAYNMIYNEFYRDQNLVTPLVITTAEAIQKRAWSKDYFTGSLPWVLKGTPPSLPITGTGTALWGAVTGANQSDMTQDAVADVPFDANTKETLEANTIDLSSASTVDVGELRLTVQIQKWMEINARAGSRHVEFLRAHYGVSPTDSRLDRPEIFGATKAPIIISEVLQTESSDAATALGTMGGHGISAGQQQVARYKVKEFGIILGIMSVLPEAMYAQGINKQWLRRTRYDYYNPQFAHLSEQAIQRMELYCTAVKADNETVFGYQGIYDEYRYFPSGVAGEMNFDEGYDHWNICRDFAAPPVLNQTFVECTPRKDFLAAAAEPAFVCHVGNIVRAARPIPAIATPGVSRI